MDQLLQNQQQGVPPAIGSYPAANMQEILFRTAAGVAPFAAQALNRGRYPSIGGTIAGLGAGLAGSFGGAMADEMSRRRLDPLQQRLAIAKQLQGLGTAAGPPEIPQLGPETTFGMPTGEEAPGTPLPMQVGPPRFNVENIPEQYRIAFAPELAPIQQYEAGKQQIAASKQAVRASEAATETSILERPGIKARTELTGLQVTEAKRATEEKARQDLANKAFRDFYQANPNASPTVLATKATQLGADESAVSPVLKAMDTMSQIQYRNDTLALHRAEQGRLAMQFKQTLEKGDVDSARQIVAAEISSLNNSTKELRGRIQTSQKIVQDILASPEDKKTATAQIAADRQQIGLDAAAKKEAEDRLKELFKGTRAGAAVIGRMPTLPAAGASGSWMTDLPSPSEAKDKVVQDEKGGWLRSDGKSWLPIPKPAWAR